MNMQEIITQQRSNIELEGFQDIQILPSNDSLAVYTLTPEDAPYDTDKALDYLSQHTRWEPFCVPESGGYEIGVTIPYDDFEQEWYDMTLEQFESTDTIETLASTLEYLSDAYIIR